MTSTMLLVLVPAATAGIFFLLVRFLPGRVRPAAAPPADYTSSGDGMTDIDRLLYEKCCRYMTEKRPFLVETFSIDDLSAAMLTNRAYISRVINRMSGRNFRQWVNYYRVMYSVDIFSRNMSLRVSELSSLSGFGSMATYNKAFKSFMDDTPGSWCLRVREGGGIVL